MLCCTVLYIFVYCKKRATAARTRGMALRMSNPLKSVSILAFLNSMKHVITDNLIKDPLGKCCCKWVLTKLFMNLSRNYKMSHWYHANCDSVSLFSHLNSSLGALLNTTKLCLLVMCTVG